jgi:bacterioferritin-associated ferredoxin
MIVCHCQAVSHRRVLEVVRDGARTAAEVGRACGAGTRCGGCVETVCELIAEARAEQNADAMAQAMPAFA